MVRNIRYCCYTHSLRQVGVHKVNLLSVDGAAPDHAAVAKIHRLVAREDAGVKKAAVVLVALVPEKIRQGKHSQEVRFSITFLSKLEKKLKAYQQLVWTGTG